VAAAAKFQLRSISPDATPEEVAAITAAIAASLAASAGPGPETAGGAGVSLWVHAARLSGRRAGYSRGDWRLSGRMGRRSRA
jgi:Acyl-CoA carboxylase epsilon subunit